MRVIPSIASGNLLEIGSELQRIQSLPRLHLDMEDGNFLPSMTFGMDMVRAIAGVWKGELDAHLMVTNPFDYLDGMHACGVKSLCAHLEALAYPATFLGRLRAHGMQAGLALNLKTGVDALPYFADQLDYVLFLTSEPDSEGMKLRPAVLSKIAQARGLLPARVSLWADGGVNAGNIASLRAAGVDTVIVGRSFFSAKDPMAAYAELLEAAEKAGA
ncbi:MAG TPA: ribulose-phosphate 3-epimerase [Anaerolineaceae bacterium]|jgi:ribulose-phosphate 3-epimerase|nr:ribulose-phosphate 3-epimerase [Anaerolineaceae bacterium]